jgi:predicted Zn finger-like uncharacterized protein
MRIRCPTCSATYEVPDALLEPLRKVRCARCAHDWMAVPITDEVVAAEPPMEAPVPEPVVEEPVAVAPPAPEPEPELVKGDTPLSAIERLASPAELSPPIRRRDRLLTAAWAASFALLAVVSVAGYTQRDRLMREWPASKRVYATLGLAQPNTKSPDDKATIEPSAR